MGDAGFQIVGDQDLGDAAKKLEGVDMGLNPGGEILGEGGFGKGVVAGAQGGHKEIGFLDLAG